MKTAGYIGRVLPDGHLSVAPEVLRELGLRPNEDVQVVLIQISQPNPSMEADADRLRARHQAWQDVLQLRDSFMDIDFNLTDDLVRMREEEDV